MSRPVWRARKSGGAVREPCGLEQSAPEARRAGSGGVARCAWNSGPLCARCVCRHRRLVRDAGALPFVQRSHFRRAAVRGPADGAVGVHAGDRRGDADVGGADYACAAVGRSPQSRGRRDGSAGGDGLGGGVREGPVGHRGGSPRACRSRHRQRADGCLDLGARGFPARPGRALRAVPGDRRVSGGLGSLADPGWTPGGDGLRAELGQPRRSIQRVDRGPPCGHSGVCRDSPAAAPLAARRTGAAGSDRRGRGCDRVGLVVVRGQRGSGMASRHDRGRPGVVAAGVARGCRLADPGCGGGRDRFDCRGVDGCLAARRLESGGAAQGPGGHGCRVPHQRRRQSCRRGHRGTVGWSCAESEPADRCAGRARPAGGPRRGPVRGAAAVLRVRSREPGTEARAGWAAHLSRRGCCRGSVESSRAQFAAGAGADPADHGGHRRSRISHRHRARHGRGLPAVRRPVQPHRGHPTSRDPCRVRCPGRAQSGAGASAGRAGASNPCVLADRFPLLRLVQRPLRKHPAGDRVAGAVRTAVGGAGLLGRDWHRRVGRAVVPEAGPLGCGVGCGACHRRGQSQPGRGAYCRRPVRRRCNWPFLRHSQ